MEYSEAVTLLDDMKSRFQDGFSSSDKSVLEALHRTLFGKEIKNKACGECYKDAFVLINLELRKLKTMPKPKSNYTLKAGAMIRRPGENRAYINPLPNDEIPEKFLADFPQEIIRFAGFPPDWEARVALRKNGHLPAGELSQEESRLTIENLRAEIARKDEEIAELRAAIEEAGEQPVADDEVANLRLENGTLTAELESANNEIASLRQEVESLKSQLNTPKTTRTRKAKEESPDTATSEE